MLRICTPPSKNLVQWRIQIRKKAGKSKVLRKPITEYIHTYGGGGKYVGQERYQKSGNIY